MKWFDTKTGREKEVVNEYLIGKLAELLSLPVIPFNLVYIPEDFIKKTHELQSTKHNYSSGYNMAVYLLKTVPFSRMLEKILPQRRMLKTGICLPV
ncbi:hypothetical protein J7E55_06395 [Bacillus sp. ISL-53]|nr:hypothetical protein [Bacillus sp. ISL-53]